MLVKYMRFVGERRGTNATTSTRWYKASVFTIEEIEHMIQDFSWVANNVRLEFEEYEQ